MQFMERAARVAGSGINNNQNSPRVCGGNGNGNGNGVLPQVGNLGLGGLVGRGSGRRGLARGFGRGKGNADDNTDDEPSGSSRPQQQRRSFIAAPAPTKSSRRGSVVGLLSSDDDDDDAHYGIGTADNEGVHLDHDAYETKARMYDFANPSSGGGGGGGIAGTGINVVVPKILTSAGGILNRIQQATENVVANAQETLQETRTDLRSRMKSGRDLMAVIKPGGGGDANTNATTASSHGFGESFSSSSSSGFGVSADRIEDNGLGINDEMEEVGATLAGFVGLDDDDYVDEDDLSLNEGDTAEKMNADTPILSAGSAATFCPKKLLKPPSTDSLHDDAGCDDLDNHVEKEKSDSSHDPTINNGVSGHGGNKIQTRRPSRRLSARSKDEGRRSALRRSSSKRRNEKSNDNHSDRGRDRDENESKSSARSRSDSQKGEHGRANETVSVRDDDCASRSNRPSVSRSRSRSQKRSSAAGRSRKSSAEDALKNSGREAEKGESSNISDQNKAPGVEDSTNQGDGILWRQVGVHSTSKVSRHARPGMRRGSSARHSSGLDRTSSHSSSTGRLKSRSSHAGVALRGRRSEHHSMAVAAAEEKLEDLKQRRRSSSQNARERLRSSSLARKESLRGRNGTTTNRNPNNDEAADDGDSSKRDGRRSGSDSRSRSRSQSKSRQQTHQRRNRGTSQTRSIRRHSHDNISIDVSVTGEDAKVQDARRRHSHDNITIDASVALKDPEREEPSTEMSSAARQRSRSSERHRNQQQQSEMNNQFSASKSRNPSAEREQVSSSTSSPLSLGENDGKAGGQRAGLTRSASIKIGRAASRAGANKAGSLSVSEHCCDSGSKPLIPSGVESTGRSQSREKQASQSGGSLQSIKRAASTHGRIAGGNWAPSKVVASTSFVDSIESRLNVTKEHDEDGLTESDSKFMAEDSMNSMGLARTRSDAEKVLGLGEDTKTADIDVDLEKQGVADGKKANDNADEKKQASFHECNMVGQNALNTSFSFDADFDFGEPDFGGN